MGAVVAVGAGGGVGGGALATGGAGRGGVDTGAGALAQPARNVESSATLVAIERQVERRGVTIAPTRDASRCS